MKLKELLEGIVDQPLPAEWASYEVQDICVDSRRASWGCLFVALPGPKTHGAHFIPEALARGARVILSDELPSDLNRSDILMLKVAQPRQVLNYLLERFYKSPTKNVDVIGVTGTKGKTTVTYLLEAVFQAWGKSCGVIGTIQHRYRDKIIAAKNTTPGLLENYQLLADMGRENVNYCFMEVSSHALDQGRVSGIPFKGALFTNLSGEHLDYHKNMDEYFEAKSRLFTTLTPGVVAVINTDDDYGARLVARCSGQVVTYGLDRPAMVMAKDSRMSFEGSQFVVVSPAGELTVTTSLFGRHNVYNILAVVALSLSAGVPISSIQKGIAALPGVPGRLERIEAGRNLTVFVDYAHTEDSLRNALLSLKNVSPSRIILVFGCGGDRDQQKRPKMGKVASSLADYTVLTNDNPRSESPEAIVQQIVAGFEGNHYEVVLDRRQAIATALQLAKPGDIVLVAGKGHEEYQIFKDRTVAFNERQIVRELLLSLS